MQVLWYERCKVLEEAWVGARRGSTAVLGQNSWERGGAGAIANCRLN